jgi:hypothetical protein
MGEHVSMAKATRKLIQLLAIRNKSPTLISRIQMLGSLGGLGSLADRQCGQIRASGSMAPRHSVHCSRESAIAAITSVFMRTLKGSP